MASHGRPSYAELAADNSRLREQLRRLTSRLDELTKRLEEATRKSKRQAAPFSKGPPEPEPKKPGRKKGVRHGTHRHAQSPPDEDIDEVLTAPLPDCCPHCQSADIRKSHQTATQYQVELPAKPLWYKFLIELGTCGGCGQAVHGRHELQTSDALGAAGVTLGARAQAAVVHLNKKCGLSWGKVSDVFRQLLGIPLSRGGGCRVMLRVAEKCRPVSEEIENSVRGSPRVRADETGWRVGGRLNWAHALVGDEAVLYRIRESRKADVAAEVLGWDFDGTLLHDGWSAYDRFEQATHAQCVDHALRRARSLIESAPSLSFPQRVIDVFTAALADRRRLNNRGCAWDSPARRFWYDEHTGRLADVLIHPKRNRANERFAKHLRRHLFDWFQSLLDPLLEAANYRGEQAMRVLVVNRKVWGGNRTWRGAQAQEIHSSILETCRLQQQNPLEFLAKFLLGKQTKLLSHGAR